MLFRLLTLFTVLFAVGPITAGTNPIDIDFYGSRGDYEQLYQFYRQNQQELLGLVNESPKRDLNVIVEQGRRNLAWLDHLNASRPNNPLSFSSKDTQTGIPIDAPKIYGPSTIYPDQEVITSGVPEQINRVVLQAETFEDELEITDEDYMFWGRKIDRLYQTTVRYITLSRWKGYYTRQRANDIRGYFFLAQRDNLLDELNNFNDLAEEVQLELQPLLINICENSTNWISRCPSLFEQARENNELEEYYNRYWSDATAKYNGFFRLEVRRRDTRWNSDQAMNFPFRTPDSEQVKDWLVEHIEDEWQWQDWELKLNFSSSAGPRVRFVPNVTPNVNGLGGNIITMNSLNSLDDYNTQWTIRHEFGHVLGFPDCYVEFYDEARDVFLNYQIDVSNLMCSRRGELKDTHFQELKRVYDRSK